MVKLYIKSVIFIASSLLLLALGFHFFEEEIVSSKIYQFILLLLSVTLFLLYSIRLRASLTSKGFDLLEFRRFVLSRIEVKILRGILIIFILIGCALSAMK